MTDAVQVELIRASTIIVPSLIGLYTAHVALRAAAQAKEATHSAIEVKAVVAEVAHKMNSILDKSRADAKEIGIAEGTAAGIQQERDRA